MAGTETVIVYYIQWLSISKLDTPNKRNEQLTKTLVVVSPDIKFTAWSHQHEKPIKELAVILSRTALF